MSKVAKTTFQIMILTIFAKFLGLLREQVLAASYGTTIYADAYVTAMKMPTMLFTAIGAAIGTSLIPIYTRVNSQKGQNDANKFISNLMNIVIIICSVLVVLCIIFAKPLVKVFAIGFEGEKLQITVNFVRIILLAIIFIGINNIVTSYLQVKNNYIVPALISIPYNIIIILSMTISLKTNVYVLIVGSLIAIIAQVLFQYPFMIKTGYTHKLKIDFKDENVKTMILLVLPVLVGVGVEQINTLVDGTLASTFGDGVVSAFNYANRLYLFVQAIFVTSVLSVIYPIMAKALASNDDKGFKDAFKRTMNSIIIFIIPITFGTIVLAKPIVRLLFQRGQFNASDTSMTASILIVYIIGIIAFSLRNLMSRAFYAMQDTKTPMINGTIAIIVNIVLNLVLSRFMGYIGLAIASSISAFVGLILFFRSLKKKVGDYNGKNILVTSIKSCIAAFIMAIITLIVYRFMHTTIGEGILQQIITLGASVVVGALTYGFILIGLKIEEIQDIIPIIKSKLKIR